jgi:hypothetical protein
MLLAQIVIFVIKEKALIDKNFVVNKKVLHLVATSWLMT